MAGLSQWFGFLSPGTVSDELPDLFPLCVNQKDFIATDVVSIYTKILTDVIERCEGLSADDQKIFWDNCLASESSDGLVTLLARAMFEKAELFLVLDKATGVVRKATASEATQIKADYQKNTESSIGVYITFKNYRRTDMVTLYSALEYCTVASLNKSLNISKAVQIKINELRASVGLADAAEAKRQAQVIAAALAKGKDIYMDSKDIVENSKPDLTATVTAMELTNDKRSFYLGFPCSYITGELNSGLGDTGQADAKAINRGLKSYFVSIVQPVVKALLQKDLTFKEDDFTQLSASLECMKTFDLTSDEFMTSDNKRVVVNKLFGLPVDTKGGPAAPDPLKTPPAVPPKIPGKA